MSSSHNIDCYSNSYFRAYLKSYQGMRSVFANPVNLQRDCPLFNKIPREIRDIIFEFVMSPVKYEYPDYYSYPDGICYRRKSQYRGPKIHSSNFHDLSTSLLRCCQLVYSETWDLPAKKSIQIYNSPGWDKVKEPQFYFPPGIQIVYLYFFVTHHRFRIEAMNQWRNSVQIVGKQAPKLRNLKIIVEDMREFINIVTYPKNSLKDIEAGDSSNAGWWGHHFQAIESLAVMKLKLHAVKEEKAQLSLMIEKAAGWRFPLTKGKQLAFKPQKTKWKRWLEIERDYDIGLWKHEPMPCPVGGHDCSTWVLSTSDTTFHVQKNGPEHIGDKGRALYVATLVFEAT